MALRDQLRQAQAVARHALAVRAAGFVEHGDIARRGQAFRRQHLAVMAPARLDQALLLADIVDEVAQRQRLQEESHVRAVVAAGEVHSASTVSLASWVRRGMMA